MIGYFLKYQNLPFSLIVVSWSTYYPIQSVNQSYIFLPKINSGILDYMSVVKISVSSPFVFPVH